MAPSGWKESCRQAPGRLLPATVHNIRNPDPQLGDQSFQIARLLFELHGDVPCADTDGHVGAFTFAWTDSRIWVRGSVDRGQHT